MKKDFKHIETKLIHAGEPAPRIRGAVSMPVFQSSTFEYSGETGYGDLKYIRLNNTPNHEVLHEKLAALENAEAAVVTASGMAAISTALLSVLTPGDHLLAQGCLYGGTLEFIIHDLPRMGVSFDFIDGDDPGDWGKKLKTGTRAVYVETITNPLLQVTDLKGVVEFANAHGLVSIIDNTFATPVNFRPPEWGFDLSLHSCTKYLNGHTDMVGGAAIGRAGMISGIMEKMSRFGGCLDPHACFLLHRGLKTLALRVKYQNGSALRLAEFLEGHRAIKKVNYPGLGSHPAHGRAEKLLDGFGGMLSFEVRGGLEKAKAVIHRLKLPIIAPSLGGVETLVTRPATTSHAGMSPEERRKQDISDSLIRVSVGLEATEDLISDFDQALK